MKTLLFVVSLILSSSVYSVSDNDRLFAVYFAAPERPLDWNSPGSLYRSLLMNQLFMTKRPFGAAVAILHCGKDSNNLGSVGISAEAEDFHIFSDVVFQGRGLGHLFTTQPGRLLSSVEALEKREILHKDLPLIQSLMYVITQKHCDRILAYLEEVKKIGFGKNFGLPHRPLMAEGMTDTSLVISVLQVAGLLENKQVEKWERVLILPKDLSGPPLTDKYISIFHLMAGSWAKNTNDGFIFRFWDPSLIVPALYKDMNDDINRAHAAGPNVRPNEPIDKTRSPVPEGSFWEQANEPQYSKKKN